MYNSNAVTVLSSTGIPVSSGINTDGELNSARSNGP